jgi:cellulose synthase/poly-beta-1,6-N-acetylglucosamine synthase-like glycosyltransferase
MPVDQEISTNAVIIDASTKEPFDKNKLLDLLRAHKIEIDQCENSRVTLEEVIPTLRKAKINPSEVFFKNLALRLGIPFVGYSKLKEKYKDERNRNLATVLPYEIISKYKVIPLGLKENVIDLAIDNPFDRRVMLTLQHLFGAWRINLHVASSKTIEWAIETIFSEIHSEKAMLDLFNRARDQSAHKVLYPRQKYFIISLIATLIICAIISKAITFMILFATISIGYFIVNPVKIYISLRGFKGARTPTQITKGEMQWVPDEDLPTYTILVPIFHEAKILPQILRNLSSFDYPKNKLDIKILMEENDKETIDEAMQLGLFGSPKKILEGMTRKEYIEFLKPFDPLIIPSGKVTTKPRACNYGLLRAEGELVVIYDAEDKPDADQLRKAAIIFLRSGDEVVCLQSKLNFYNAGENILTKWFSIEYANWYEFYLQGLDWIEAPIPLGGTSNHFRKKGLDELGRWDPYNVTEDADLGLRLARNKRKTELIESHTYEEATMTAKSWIRQRSRWYKGHLQTYLVHMRHPKQLLKELGSDKFLKFQLTFGTSVFIPLINPVLWCLTIASLLLPVNLGWLDPGYLKAISIFNLAVGNITYLAVYVVACVKLKKYRYTPYALLMPVYWILHSIASWRGLIQLIRNPFYWDKTSHGVTKYKT